jgi:hypothetical protein|tara:strand:+ start:64 stop:252 length:189 start_codon:yes stop_codon:yes gene_type:complete
MKKENKSFYKGKPGTGEKFNNALSLDKELHDFVTEYSMATYRSKADVIRYAIAQLKKEYNNE